LVINDYPSTYVIYVIELMSIKLTVA